VERQAKHDPVFKRKTLPKTRPLPSTQFRFEVPFKFEPLLKTALPFDAEFLSKAESITKRSDLLFRRKPLPKTEPLPSMHFRFEVPFKFESWLKTRPPFKAELLFKEESVTHPRANRHMTYWHWREHQSRSYRPSRYHCPPHHPSNPHCSPKAHFPHKRQNQVQALEPRKPVKSTSSSTLILMLCCPSLTLGHRLTLIRTQRTHSSDNHPCQH
jgi:hypothetical protein